MGNITSYSGRLIIKSLLIVTETHRGRNQSVVKYSICFGRIKMASHVPINIPIKYHFQIDSNTQFNFISGNSPQIPFTEIDVNTSIHLEER